MAGMFEVPFTVAEFVISHVTFHVDHAKVLVLGHQRNQQQ